MSDKPSIDDRLDRLTETVQKVADNQLAIQRGIQNLIESQEKNEAIMATCLDSIKRLERIALAHEVHLDDVDAILRRLEGRPKPKPQ